MINRRLALQLLGAGYSWAQRSGSNSASHAVIDVAVTGSDGKPVPNLAPSDFTVVVGTEPEPLTAFAAVDAVSGATRDAAPLPLPMKIEPGEVHRAFVLIADDTGISADEVADLRAALLQFVDGQVAPRDTVALFPTSGGESALERLTSDKAVVRAAIRKIAFNPAAAQPSAPAWMPILPVVLGALRTIEGRKGVVLFCRRMPQTCAFAQAVALANQAASNIYLVRGGNAPAPPACFDELAGGTGGLTLSGHLAVALNRVAADQGSYYLLGIKPPATAGTTLSVKLSRPGLELRARRHPVRPKVDPFLTEATSPQSELRRIMASPLDAGTMRLRLSAGFRRTAVDNILELALLVDGRDVSFTRRLNGKNEAGVDVLVRAFDASGATSVDRSNTVALAASDEEYRHIADDGLALALRIPAARSGVFQIYAGVRDATSSNTGLCHTLVEVPDISKGDLVVSGIRLFAAASAEASEEEQELASVTRVFKPGQQIAYNCAIYNPQPDDQNTADLEVSTVMYAEGHAVYRGSPISVTSPNISSNSWLTLRGTLEVGEHTAAGDFVFQVLVTDKVKPRTASQWIGFTLK